MLTTPFINYKTILYIILIFFTISCSDSKPDRLIQSFSNDLNSSYIPADRTIQIRVYASYDDGTKEDVTDGLIWSSSDEDLATVSSGLVSTKSIIDTVDISYKTKDKLSNGSPFYEKTLSLKIEDLTLETITLSESSLEISVGASKNIIATGSFDDNSTYDITDDCDWSSTDSSIATVGNTSGNKGLVEGILEGSTTISATDSGINSSLDVSVTKIHYTKLTINITKTSFNVEQTIQLQAIATTDKNEQIILDNSEVTWKSDDEKVVSIDEATLIATAKTKGTAKITVMLIADNSLTDNTTLSVIEDTYMRLFEEDDVEIEFSQPKTHYFSKDSDKQLAEFSIKAVGDTFTISNLIVTDFAGLPIIGNDIGFIGLKIGDEIKVKDGKITFTLSHNKKIDELRYSFRINDKVGSTFVQNYETED